MLLPELEEPAEQEEQVPPAAPQCARGTWLVAIFSGLIFGVATGVIGPVLFYWENHPDGAFAKLSSLQQGIIAAAVLAGAALGAVAGGPFADWWGRKLALLITGARMCSLP